MRHKTREQLIAFELGVRDAFARGELPFLVHLCGGNEGQLIEIFDDARPGDWFFSTHRNHYHYLLAGGSEAELMAKIRDGRSMFVFDRKLNFVSSAILGGLVATAAGVAWEIRRSEPSRCRDRDLVATAAGVAWEIHHKAALPRSRSGDDSARPPRVWCFVGDGAEDNGHLYEAVLWAWGNRLPVTFILEDNDRSVDVPISERTRGFRMDWPPCVRRYHYKPTFPHAGPGLKSMIQFDPAIVAKFTPAI